MKLYRKGADFERKIVNEYRKQGHVALRSAGSHSPIDVVVVQKDRIILMQCKKKKLTKGEFEEAAMKLPLQKPKKMMVYPMIWDSEGIHVIGGSFIGNKVQKIANGKQ